MSNVNCFVKRIQYSIYSRKSLTKIYPEYPKNLQPSRAYINKMRSKRGNKNFSLWKSYGWFIFGITCTEEKRYTVYERKISETEEKR